MQSECVDVVYTWVDDRFPGYREQLAQFAQSNHDTNPNRTRDNLDLMRYSLRSLERFAPWVRNVYLLSCRPQVPAWINRENSRLKIVHHDELMPRETLPTFNSFAIVSHLSRLPGLSERFVYFEDDMLLAAPTDLQTFFDAHGAPLVYPRVGRTAPEHWRTRQDISPWNAALAHANHLVRKQFKWSPRPAYSHVPLGVRKDLWNDMLDAFAPAIAHTRSSRFRSVGNVPPEYLYTQYLLATGKGCKVGVWRTYQDSIYYGIENSYLLALAYSALIQWLRPKMLALNDNFGDAPDPRVERCVRAMLDRLFPDPSSFELD